MARRKRIAVIGAGPKAAALAAWGHAWAQTRAELAGLGEPLLLPEAPEVLVFERAARGGAAWVGGLGYSDGTPELCTPRDADVTYGAGSVVPAPAGKSALVAAQLLASLERFRAPPAAATDHRAFGDYVDHVLHEARGPDVQLLFSHTVTRLAPTARGGWSVTANGKRHAVDGVVVTGPGPSRVAIPGTPKVKTRVKDALDYWTPSREERVRMVAEWRESAGEEGSPHVVLAGVGGAAAAIAVDLCEIYGSLGPDNDDGSSLRLTFVAPRAGLFTRGESAWETRAIRDADVWARLSRELRAEVTDHLVSGVVFRRVLEQLESWVSPDAFRQAVSVEVEPGKVVWVDDGADESWGLPSVSAPLRVSIERQTGGLVVHGAQLLVHAVGFDASWFLGLVAPEGLAAVLRAAPLRDLLDEAVAVKLETFAGDAGPAGAVECLRHLHLPMFAGGSLPPGLGNLLNLGHLAERILGRYL